MINNKRRILMSFLGISRYLPVRYYFEKEDPKHAGDPECFVQISLARKIGQELDAVILFLTTEAEKRNWNDRDEHHPEANFEKGLRTRIEELQREGLLRTDVTIEAEERMPEGFSTAETWEIFQRVLNRIGPGDEIYLDLTHAFRHIPMLALTLMNYSTAVRGSHLKAVYYGAFEAVLNEHKTDIKGLDKVPEANRFAPVLDLRSLAELQQWSYAAQSFVNTGNAGQIAFLALQEAQPLLREHKGGHEQASRLRSLARSFREVSDQLATCRGREIGSGRVLQSVREQLATLQSEGLFLKPMKALLDTIDRKLSALAETPSAPWFDAAVWCNEHGMVQQGITLLREGVLTCLMETHKNAGVLDPGSITHREMAAQALYIYSKKLPEEGWLELAKANKDIISDLLAFPGMRILSKIYDKLTNVRNSINHAGYLANDPVGKADFRKVLTDAITLLRDEYFSTASG